jgi:type III restriction enzyme
MITLKGYQRRGLDVLEAYLGDVADSRNPKGPFENRTGNTYFTVPDLPDIPYVCLRVPTGGGKTLMASHTVGIAARTYLGREQALCLWLVPSNTIRSQTLKALRTHGHPYREALEEYFDGRLRIMDMEEALYVQRSVLDGETVVIVSTLAAHRVGDTEIRKVYESSGALHHHFTGLSAQQTSLLLPGEGGVPGYSLANVFRLRNPVIIMDEAHRARTSLSFDTLARFRPSCIVEFTATPETDSDPSRGQFRSNVLYHVSVRELKDADMVKLPIRLRTHPEWKQVVADAVAMTNRLGDLARREHTATGEYLRPIALLQAQPTYRDRESVTVELVKKCLIDDCRVLEEEIAIQTGQIRDLEDEDLSSPACRIRFVITVEALREGWDCPFSYVLCTASNVQETAAVEQLLGRILRLPAARKKQIEELNCAYAYVVSPRFLEAAGQLEQGLVDGLGYETFEAGGAIQPQLETPSLFDTAPGRGILRFQVQNEPHLNTLPVGLQSSVTFDPGTSQVVLLTAIESKQLQPLRACLGSDSDRAALDSALLSLEPRDPFRIPLLGLKNRQGQLELFESDTVVQVPWNPASGDSTLNESHFSQREPGVEAGEIDATSTGQVRHHQYQTPQEIQSILVEEQENRWPIETLANWLTRQRHRPNLIPTQAGLYCAKVLQSLIDNRGFAREVLIRRRFSLARAVHRRLDELQSQHDRQAWQMLLDGCDYGRAEIDPQTLFLTVQEAHYQPDRLYQGRWQPNKHYFPRLIGHLNDEELACAQHLDNHAGVKYWLRNLVRDPRAFRLPTSTDYFYPDLICLLADNRVLAVEYKGRQYEDSRDTREKELVGKLWADRSNGKCLFLMVVGQDFSGVDELLARPR